MDRKTYLAVHAAGREAAAALRWASASHDPVEQPLAAAHAWVLLETGRLREGGAITERLIASPPADPEVRSLALCAHSTYLLMIGQSDESLRFADEAYRLAPDAKTRCVALIRRGVSNVFARHASEAVKDHAEATALARELHDPVLVAGALVYEAQALMQVPLPDEAASRLTEARTVGMPVDAHVLYYLDGFLGDLAVTDGRPEDALEPYARSLEQDLADGFLMEIMWDLFGVAEALAALGHDAEALEIAGMAEGQNAEVGASDPVGAEHLAALTRRLGPARASELKQRGQAVAPAERVARACQLARSHALAPTAALE